MSYIEKVFSLYVLKKFIILIIFFISFTFYEQLKGNTLRPENILNQQQQTLEREIEREKLQREIEAEKIDLLPKIEEEKSSESEESEECFILQNISFKNSTILSGKNKENLAKDFIEKCITLELLDSITRRVTNFYISRGYITTRAFINPQNIKSGFLEVLIIEGKLEQIEFEDDVGFFNRTEIISAFGNIEGKILKYKGYRARARTIKQIIIE